jgi:hypothetical protein
MCLFTYVASEKELDLNSHDEINDNLARILSRKWSALNENALKPQISSEMMGFMESKFIGCHYPNPNPRVRDFACLFE